MTGAIKNSPMSSAITGIDKAKDSKSVLKKEDKAGGLSFGETLSQQVDTAAAKETAKEAKDDKNLPSSEKPILKFSNHALERMSSRGIHFSPEQITKIEQGMQKAQKKGAKETLVLSDDSALIVSLKNNTVVTVMDKNMMKENVFTNIDATVFV